MAVLVAPGAHASDETSQVQAVVEVGVSQGTALSRPWAPRTSYSLSKNPTPQVLAGLRLRQDVTVKPKVPDLLPLERPISPSPRQNAQLQRDIEYLDELGAENIRVNQQQLNLENKARVGINRPDLQFDYKGRRYNLEYDSTASGRGPGHQSRLTANDPEGEIILIIIPEE